MIRRRTKLSGVALFSGCSRGELATLERITTPVAVKKGTVLIRQGEPARQFFVIVSGTVSVRVEREGVETSVAELGAGDFVGETGLLTHSPRNASVVAEEDTELLVCSIREFWQILNTSDVLAERIRSTSSGRAVELAA